MKRPRRPSHLPDPLVTAAESMPQRHRCRPTARHRKPKRTDWRDEWRSSRSPQPTTTEPRPVPLVFIQRVTQSIAEGLRLMIVYEDREGRRTKRHVMPRCWVIPGDLFTSHCELRGEDRDFRVLRILDCQIVAGDPQM